MDLEKPGGEESVEKSSSDEKSAPEAEEKSPLEEKSPPKAEKKKPPPLLGVAMFSLPVRSLRCSTPLFSKSTQREIQSAAELKAPSQTAAGGPAGEKSQAGGGSPLETSLASVDGKQSSPGPSRIPRPTIKSVPASSPDGAGLSSKVKVSSAVLKRRKELLSQMASAVEKKHKSPSGEGQPPVMFNNVRVTFAEDDQEMDWSKYLIHFLGVFSLCSFRF